MLVLGFLDRKPANQSIHSYYRELIVQANNSIFICDLSLEIIRMQGNMRIPRSNIGSLISIFRYFIKSNDKINYFLERLISAYNQSALEETQYTVCPFVFLWSDLALPYLSYYESYNYNKTNIVKRIVGFTMPDGENYKYYDLRYLGKQLKHIIKVILDTDYTYWLYYFLAERFLPEEHSDYAEELGYRIEQDFVDNKITAIVLQSKKILKHNDADLKDKRFLIDTNNAMIAELIIVTRMKSSHEARYQIQLGLVAADPDKSKDFRFGIKMLYLALQIGQHTIDYAKQWFTKLENDFVKKITYIELISDEQLLITLRRGFKINQHKSRTLYLRYIEIKVNVKGDIFNFIIIAPQNVINNYIYEIKYYKEYRKIIENIFQLINDKKSLMIELPSSDDDDDEDDDENDLRVICVFIIT